MVRTIAVALLVMLGMFVPRAAAQDEPPASLVAGSLAPPLFIDQWPRGVPVTRFERGRVYIVEFWATWCTPCHLVVPKLTELQKKHAALTVIGVAGSEQATTVHRDDRVEKVQDYVSKRSEEIGYAIAYDGSGEMWRHWMIAAQRGGIPVAFIIGPDGRIAWLGNPLVPDFEREVEATLRRPDVTTTPTPVSLPRPLPRARAPRPNQTAAPADRTPAVRPVTPAPKQPPRAPREIKIEFVPEGRTADAQTSKPTAKPSAKSTAKPTTKPTTKPATKPTTKPAATSAAKPAAKPAVKAPPQSAPKSNPKAGPKSAPPPAKKTARPPR